MARAQGGDLKDDNDTKHPEDPDQCLCLVSTASNCTIMRRSLLYPVDPSEFSVTPIRPRQSKQSSLLKKAISSRVSSTPPITKAPGSVDSQCVCGEDWVSSNQYVRNGVGRCRVAAPQGGKWEVR